MFGCVETESEPVEVKTPEIKPEPIKRTQEEIIASTTVDIMSAIDTDSKQWKTSFSDWNKCLSAIIEYFGYKPEGTEAAAIKKNLTQNDYTPIKCHDGKNRVINLME
ncbi:TPA: hypothetical protein LR286_003256 [Enterobacter hormaechei]|nr:hypothetical protein [Enterobacter hormaechei]HBL9125588.1 hypothetical protein [Enterobacter hormaechei]HCC6647857.1 hypothetical protein [Enterobacter hormaechei]